MFIPEVTKLIRFACEQLHYTFEDLDHGNGYLFRVSYNNSCVHISASRGCKYPLNNATATGIAKDKAFTNRILESAGIATIEGNVFFVTKDHIKLRNPGHEIDDAFDYAEKTGYPIFCKPNQGSGGNFAQPILSQPDLETYIQRVRNYYESILLQEYIKGTEYRLFWFDDSVRFFYQRTLPAIHGNGENTFTELLDLYNSSLAGKGITQTFPDRYLGQVLSTYGFSVDSVLPADVTIHIPGRSNLSAGGGSLNLSIGDHPIFTPLARTVSSLMKLRICGIDVIDTSSTNDLSNLIVLEVNGNPSLSSLREEYHSVAVEIWKEILRKVLTGQ